MVIKRGSLIAALMLSCAPDINIEEELKNYCVANPYVGFCATPDLGDELEKFCEDNPNLLLCVQPANILTTLGQYCLANPELSLCSGQAGGIGKFCEENPLAEICQENGVLFMADSYGGAIAKRQIKKGHFLTVGGSSVPYVQNVVKYQDGVQISEIVFLEGLPSGTVMESAELVRFFPGVVPSSGSVGIAYLQEPQFVTLFGDTAASKEICEGSYLSVRREADEKVKFSVAGGESGNVLEKILALGQYEILAFPECAGTSYVISNSGSSFFLGKVQQLDNLPIVTRETCWNDFLSGSKSYADFLIPDHATPDGYVRSIVVQPPDCAKACLALFHNAK